MKKIDTAAFPTRVATSTDVARLAGVSRSAVSRTFTAGASVAAETRARVLEAARTLRYRPNQVARSLITGRSMIVALAISHLDNQYYPPIVERVSDALGRAGYRVLLYITHGEKDHEPLLDELLRYGVDGLILASQGAGSMLVAKARATGMPVVMVNNVQHIDGVPRVTGDNAGGGATVARFLMAGGHRRFAFLAGLPEASSSQDRLAAFRNTLAAAGQGDVRVVDGRFEYDTARHAVAAVLARPDAPDALFCANDHMAFAALHAARAAGMEVGRALSIVGFDNVTIGAWPGLDLTSYGQEAEAMADLTVGLMTARLAARTLRSPDPGGPDHLVVPGRLMVRSSARMPSTGTLRSGDGGIFWEQ